ncbi:MAG TPA: phenylalanine--tRNA ligase subunit beta [Gammaproteobacteria bacterium]|nr:phenylalanine--tRNA ligase subunit beta [Gammaproteobacteria bacterium]
MKVSIEWLREFIDIEVPPDRLAGRLTLAGLEVSAQESAHPGFEGVVTGEVTDVAPHPDADRLRVCKVQAEAGTVLTVVCGAPNVRVGMKAPLMKVGGRLPDGSVIKRTRLRGVESEGMLCSARELGLSVEAGSLLELPTDAPVGMALDEYLRLDDTLLEIELTPNRGDCLGMLGVARDAGAALDVDLRVPDCAAVTASHKETFPVRVDVPEACPVYVGRIIKGIRAEAETPVWMRERLRRAGLRSIHPVVDVTQYVMLELGQPMHAYDLAHLSGGIVVRMANPGESAGLLNGQSYALESDVLVIADHDTAQGLGGIMGGSESNVRDSTADVFLEAAFFAPAAISGRPRRLDLNTDAAYRFERGVDPAGQVRAVERATALILDICGGEPGPVQETVSAGHVPPRGDVALRRTQLERVLGMAVPDATVARILSRLGMAPEVGPDGWRVRAPSHRFDIAIEADLIEEVGRIHGYERIPVRHYPMPQAMGGSSEARLSASRLRRCLVERGYQEAITYSFVAPALQRAVSGGAEGLVLANPISAELSAMRLSLWPGLLDALQYNLNRQQERVKLFEIGMRFIPQANDIKQEKVLSGIAHGTREPEQWGLPAEALDFADLKNDVEALVAASSAAHTLRYVAAEHPALHPGQSARIESAGKPVGWLGALHPALTRELGLNSAPYLFEIMIEPLLDVKIPEFEAISRFPAIRRDLAVLVAEAVTAEQLVGVARAAAPELIRQVKIFDIYRKSGVDSGRKSVALGLILQDSSRTLTDEAADAAIAQVTAQLRQELGATIRD